MGAHTIDQIWTYPVKSMLGGRVQSADLRTEGISGDRLWALRDEARGAIASARKISTVSRVAASVDASGAVVMTLADGTEIRGDDPDVSARLSAALDHPVSFWARPPASDDAFYRRGAPDSDDLLTEMRSIFGREDDEPLPDFSIFPPSMLEYEYPPGTLYDCYPLMIMSTSALRSLRDALPDAAIDERRFRPSLVIDTGSADGHPEFEWAGRRMRLGSAEIEFGAPCPRCVAVTREFGPDMPADRRVLRHVVRDLDQNVGVYATIVTPGRIAVGDAAELLD